jgi:hypothetical protein
VKNNGIIPGKLTVMIGRNLGKGSLSIIFSKIPLDTPLEELRKTATNLVKMAGFLIDFRRVLLLEKPSQ